MSPVMLPPDDDNNKSSDGDGWAALISIIICLLIFLFVPVWGYYLAKWWNFLDLWVHHVK